MHFMLAYNRGLMCDANQGALPQEHACSRNTKVCHPMTCQCSQPAAVGAFCSQQQDGGSQDNPDRITRMDRV